MLPILMHSGMTGAPTNTNAAGTVVNILTACLVTGFNVKAPTSLSVTGGVATLTYATAHGYETQRDVTVAGASVEALNGRKRITVTSVTVLTFVAPDVADGSASGAIETRYTPLGWQLAFNGANKAVYRSPNVQTPRHFFRVEDLSTSANGAKVFGYVDMSDVDTGTSRFPTVQQSAQSANQSSIFKSGNATSRPWAIVGDDSTVYGFMSESEPSVFAFDFGAFQSFKPADAFNSYLVAYHDNLNDGVGTSGFSQGYLARTFTGLGGSVRAGNIFTHTGSGASGAGSSQPYPGAVDNGVLLAGPYFLGESATVIRGVRRGLLSVLNAVPKAVCTPFLELPNALGIDGRVAIFSCSANNVSSVAVTLDEEWPL